MHSDRGFGAPPDDIPDPALYKQRDGTAMIAYVLVTYVVQHWNGTEWADLRDGRNDAGIAEYWTEEEARKREPILRGDVRRRLVRRTTTAVDEPVPS